jgi:hypothetical protein
MALVVKVDGLEHSFPITVFSLQRKIGEPLRLTAFIQLEKSIANWLEDLAQRLLSSPAEMEVRWKDSPLFSKVSVSWAESGSDNAEPGVILTGLYTKIPLKSYTAHKKVLKAANLKQLLDSNFSDIVSWENSIGGHLSQIEFPDKEKTNHIQNGISDFEMLQHLIRCYNQMSSPENAILISGNALNEKYQLIWAQDKKYRDLYLNEKRKIDKSPQNMLSPRLEFGKTSAPTLKDFEGGQPSMHISYNIEHGNVDTTFWDDWKTKNVPIYYNDNFVSEINDSFRNIREDFLDWASCLNAIPKNNLLSVPKMQSFGAWAQNGKVLSRNPKNHWMQVTLENFESGFDTVDVRISTPYSGKSETGGLHLVPEENSDVLVMKHADWMSPIILINNIRSKDADSNAPYWQLEDPATWHFGNMDFKLNKSNTEATEGITFKSKNHTVISSEEIALKTNGVTAKMNNTEMHIT